MHLPGKTPIMKTNLLLFPRFFLLFAFLSLAGCHHSARQHTPMDGRVFYDGPTMSAKAEVAAPEPEPLPSRPPYSTDSLVTEEYDRIVENDFLDAITHPLSTFSIDVDNASYSNIRRYLLEWERLPPPDAVRLEELINYFDYDYPEPAGEHPFSVYSEVSVAPWNPAHQLVHIGLQGKSLNYEDLHPSNLVFLVDCSGSMEDENKLPLLKKSLNILLENLGGQDRIAIVAYAGAAGLVLPSTPATERATIRRALDRLEAGGSTAGGEGIELAYQVAVDNLIEGGNNRVILATDGDFNVGISSTGDLVRLIEARRQAHDIYLTICGFGMGNYKDGRMEQISNAGNGNYFYIDSEREADKVFRREMRANLFTIAKDVKIQVEFNPVNVKGYRLLGYENRRLADEDFNDDRIDAGELGAGHTVTALYEIIPTGSEEEVRRPDELKYQTGAVYSPAGLQGELLTVKLRYKRPEETASRLLEQVLAVDAQVPPAQSSVDFRFAAAVTEYGLLLRQSAFRGAASYEQVRQLAAGALGEDPDGDRKEFLELAARAGKLAAAQKQTQGEE